LKPQNETDTVTNGNLVTTLETVLAKSNDITLAELYAAEQLIQERELQIIAEEYGMPLDLPVCHLLRTIIQDYRDQADVWREKATLRPDDHTWVALCNMIANWYDNKADSLQGLYDRLPCD
jgi:hypothetical protein